MQDERLEALDGVFQITNGQGLVISMGDHNATRPVEIPNVFALEIRDISTVTGDNGVKTCN